MSVQQAPDLVLAAIPGWEDASCTELSGGLTNRSYLVEANGIRGVLKIDAEVRTLPYNSREDEGRIQTAAACHGLAGRVLFIDERVYMSEYIDGHVWSRADLDNEQNLVNLAQALKALHSLPLTGRTFDASDAMRRYLSGIVGNESDIAQRCLQIAIAQRAPQDLCCCHNDLVAGNIISLPQLRFLDWEFACDNDPFFDIATVITHHDLPDAQADLFLDSYCDGEGERWRSRLQQQMRLYDALHWLWLTVNSGNDENDGLLDEIAQRLTGSD